MEKPRKLSPIKRFERYFSAIFKLGRTEGMAKTAHKRLNGVDVQIDSLEGRAGSSEQDIRRVQTSLEGALNRQNVLEQRIEATTKSLGEVSHKLTDTMQSAIRNSEHELRSEIDTNQRVTKGETALLARLFGDLSRRTEPVSKSAKHSEVSTVTPTRLPSDDGFNLFKDSFYHRLENRYRGSVEDITERLRIYLPDVEAAYLRTGEKPAMDIGCGRGEWLSLLKRVGIEGFGVDTNAIQIDGAIQQGLDVRLGDALEALSTLENNSLSALSAHHLIEHLPFDAVAWITREAMRVLAPGGILLFETPNPANVLVGATTFHTDPTHLKPMPKPVLEVLFETAGFHPVDIRPIHPHGRFQEFLEKPDFNNELANLMFGPQDIAALGTKPFGE